MVTEREPDRREPERKDPHPDPESSGEARRREEERRRHEYERSTEGESSSEDDWREADERRRHDADRRESTRRRAEDLARADSERLTVGSATSAASSTPDRNNIVAEWRIPVGFLDPLSLLLEQAGSPASANGPIDTIRERVEASADRLDLAWGDVMDAALDGLSRQEARVLSDGVDADLDSQLRRWQRRCATNPFDIVGIKDDADAIGRSIRRSLDRLSRARSSPERTQQLERGLRALADQVATQLATAAEPVKLIIGELSGIASRGSAVDSARFYRGDALAKDNRSAERRSALSTGEFWSTNRKLCLTPPDDPNTRETVAGEIKAIEDADLFDLGLTSALVDWQKEIERTDGDRSRLFKATLRAAAIIAEYSDRLEPLKELGNRRADMLRVNLGFISERMATQLAQASGAEMPRLVADLDRVSAAVGTNPPDQRLEQRSKRLRLDDFWREAHQSGLGRVTDPSLRAEVQSTFDGRLAESLREWEKQAYHDPIDNLVLYRAADAARERIAAHRAALAEIDDTSLSVLDDALRLCAARISEHLQRFAAAGAFWIEA